jgi:hypothetical protein
MGNVTSCPSLETNTKIENPTSSEAQSVMRFLSTKDVRLARIHSQIAQVVVEGCEEMVSVVQKRHNKFPLQGKKWVCEHFKSEPLGQRRPLTKITCCCT